MMSKSLSISCLRRFVFTHKKSVNFYHIPPG
jgi:hypothetical protein